MTEKQWIKADFHMHTFYSKDSNVSPKKLIETAKKAGLQAIAVTDHNTTKGAKQVAQLAGNDLIVFIGQETKTLEGEVIILNVGHDIPKKQGIEETCQYAKKHGGFLILPHPFDGMRSGADEHTTRVLPYIDAMEIFNARSFTQNTNNKARDFAKKHNIPITAGSDSHTHQELGSAYALIHAKPNKKDILEAIRKGRVRTAGKRTGIVPHLRTIANRFRKHPSR